MNITAHITLPLAGTTSLAAAVAPNAKTARTWAHPAARVDFPMTAKPTNPRPLSPPEWLSP